MHESGDKINYYSSILFLTLLLLLLLHPFNGHFSWTTWVSWHQKGKTSLDLNEARDDGVLGVQWHQLDQTQTVCISLQTDNHTNTPLLDFYRPDALPDADETEKPQKQQEAQLSPRDHVMRRVN